MLGAVLHHSLQFRRLRKRNCQRTAGGKQESRTGTPGAELQLMGTSLTTSGPESSGKCSEVPKHLRVEHPDLGKRAPTLWAVLTLPDFSAAGCLENRFHRTDAQPLLLTQWAGTIRQGQANPHPIPDPLPKHPNRDLLCHACATCGGTFKRNL